MGGSSSKNERELKFVYLNRTPFALHFSEPELRIFSKAFTLHLFDINENVFDQGQLPDKWFIVGQGTVDISIMSDDTNISNAKRFLCYKKAGDFFGESALGEEQKPRSATASVINEPLHVLEITKKKLEDFLTTKPDWRDRVFDIIGRRMENYLGEIPFLANTSFRELQLLGSMLHYVPLKSGKELFHEGSIGKSLFLVYRGSVNAVSFVDGEEVILNTITEGQFFGEIGLMINMPRTATIVAEDDCLLLELRKDDLQNFLKIAPETAVKFKRIMKKRIAEHFRKYQVPFFSAIPDESFADLAELCLIEEYEPGRVIFAEGEVGSTFYIIAHGEVEVTADKRDDRGVVSLTSMGPGQYFGEIALIRDTPRTATITTTTRCVILSITKANFETFFKQVPEAVADFQIKLARYDCELKFVLSHPVGVEFFHRHLEAEYSIENLHFWEDVQQWKKLFDQEEADTVQIETEAARITRFYIDAVTAEEEINIKGNVKKQIAQRIVDHDIDVDMFQEAYKQVMNMMEKDSFKRFKQSPLFQDFLMGTENYETESRKRMRRSTLTNLQPIKHVCGAHCTTAAPPPHARAGDTVLVQWGRHRAFAMLHVHPCPPLHATVLHPSKPIIMKHDTRDITSMRYENVTIELVTTSPIRVFKVWIEAPQKIQLPRGPLHTNMDVVVDGERVHLVSTLPPSSLCTASHGTQIELVKPRVEVAIPCGQGLLLEQLGAMLNSADAVEALGMKPVRGVLLYGPPGTGKTLAVRTLAAIHHIPITTLDLTNIASLPVTQAASAMRHRFAEAASQSKRSIVFLDEVDCISSGTTNSIYVSILLECIDSFSVFVIAATNRRHHVDSRLRHPSRLEVELAVPAPDEETRRQILQPFEAPDWVATDTVGFVGADLAELAREALLAGSLDDSQSWVHALRGMQVPSSRRDYRPTMSLAWSSVGGLDTVQSKIRLVLRTSTQQYRRFGLAPPRGILLYGPPGTGKTTIAKAVASSEHAAFISCSGAQIYSSYVGEAEQNLRDLFTRARANQPCILFLDEVETIAGKRGAADGSSGVQDRILATLLNEMDGIEHAGQDVLVLGATNCIENLDDALLRPGRFDYVMHVPLPSRDDALRILEIHTQTMPLAPDVDLALLAALLPASVSGATIQAICHEAALCSLRRSIASPAVTMDHMKQSITNLGLDAPP